MAGVPVVLSGNWTQTAQPGRRGFRAQRRTSVLGMVEPPASLNRPQPDPGGRPEAAPPSSVAPLDPHATGDPTSSVSAAAAAPRLKYAFSLLIASLVPSSPTCLPRMDVRIISRRPGSQSELLEQVD